MSKRDKKKVKKADDIFEKKPVEETDEEDTEDEEDDEEETSSIETVKKEDLEEGELKKVKELAAGVRFAVQQLGKKTFAVVNNKMEIVRSYTKGEGVEDPEACAASYCEKMIKKSL